KTCSLRAIGLLRDYQQPSRDRCGRATAPPIWCWEGQTPESLMPRRPPFAPGANTGKSVNMHSTNPNGTIDPADLEKSIAWAHEVIRVRSGAAYNNVSKRFMLEMYGKVAWPAVPELPIEIMLPPMCSASHLHTSTSWPRPTIVPLLVLAALKQRAKNPKGVGI